MPLEPGVIAHLRHGKPLWAEYLTKQPKQNRKQQNHPASTPTAPPRDRRNPSSFFFFLKKNKKFRGSGGRGQLPFGDDGKPSFPVIKLSKRPRHGLSLLQHFCNYGNIPGEASCPANGRFTPCIPSSYHTNSSC